MLAIIGGLVTLGFIYSWFENGFLNLITIFLLFIIVVILIADYFINQNNEKIRLLNEQKKK